MVLTSQTRIYSNMNQVQSSIIEHKSLGEIMCALLHRAKYRLTT